MPRGFRTGIGPLDIAIDAPLTTMEVRDYFQQRRGAGNVPTRLHRMRRAEAATGVPFSPQKEDLPPAGPLGSIGGAVAGLAGIVGGTALGSGLGPLGSIGGGLAGYAGASALTRRVLKPLDEKFFGKQIQRTNLIKSELERFRGV